MGAKNGKTHLGGDGLHKDIQGKTANPYQFRPSRRQRKHWQLWQESLKMSSCKVTTTQLTSGSSWRRPFSDSTGQRCRWCCGTLCCPSYTLHRQSLQPQKEAKKVWREFKEATARQRSLSAKKLALQVKADRAKEAWQKLAQECQDIQKELDDQQKIVDQVGKQYEEKVLKADLLEPPAPNLSQAREDIDKLALAEEEKQNLQTIMERIQNQLQQQLDQVKTGMETLQQQQMEKDAKIQEWLDKQGDEITPERKIELEKLLARDEAKRRRVADAAIPQQG